MCAEVFGISVAGVGGMIYFLECSRMPPIYVHGGLVVSRNDGDTHYVSATKVAALYGLSPGIGVKIVGDRELECNWDGLHLYPRSDGRYNLSSALMVYWENKND